MNQVDEEGKMQLYENFISYRRSETLSEVQSIYHALTSKGYSTFCDIYSLKSGRFDENLLNTIKKCTNFILVLNNHSLDRCGEKKDWLKFEIETALATDKNIICVFIEDFEFPNSLPYEIDDIRYYNGIKYDLLYFTSFIDSLCARFLVKGSDIERSRPECDFLIDGSVLVKYLGNAPIVRIPEGIKSVGRYAFKDKTQITDISFPDGIESIGAHAFDRCINITNLIFPDSLKEIDEKAFMRCYNLSFIAFNDNLQSIGKESFSFCGKLKVVRFGKGIKEISSSAFNNCDKLAIFDVDAENESFLALDGILYSKDGKRAIRCPEGYTLDLINLLKTVEIIEPWCFSKCLYLVDVVLPRNLKRVGAFAFNDCRNIMSLTLGDEIDEFDVSALDGWNKDQQIVVSKRFNPLIKYKINQKINERVVLEYEESKDLPEYVMIKTTFESVEEASKMAKMLINNHYIASAQLDELNVFYTWKDEACNENEIELNCITRGVLYDKVKTFIKQNHSYECCQIICIPIVKTTDEFGDWINEQTII